MPRPPLVPQEPATRPNPPAETPKPVPVRAPATSSIDDLWAQGDDEATNVTDRAGLLAAMAAKNEAPGAAADKPAPAAASPQKPALLTPRPAAVSPYREKPRSRLLPPPRRSTR